MLRIAIIEDNQQEAEQLCRFIERYQKEALEECVVKRYSLALDFIAEYEPKFDLILMDIDMPYLNGMDAAKKLRAVDEVVSLIFVTNIAQFAVHGYEVGAVGFMLKPISYFDLSVKLNKVLRIVKRNGIVNKSVIVNTQKGKTVITINSLFYVDVQGHNLFYHTDCGVYEVRGTLKGAEKELISHGFARCSNYCVVKEALI